MVAFGGDYYLLSLIVLYVLQPSSLGLRCKGKLNILIRQLFFCKCPNRYNNIPKRTIF